ncbi:expansin-A25-like [Lolium rigidum]|uniref:expansin-A25-like n=1 Tax=Lolium rigidum TaxID=89674 RepID=UPI001F5DA7B6|nr:expansin-A25-like [Lolium rigidum]
MDRLLALFVVVLVAACFAPARAGWSQGSATFYGGADASGTMGGACGYGNLYETGHGTSTAALSSVLFNDGASCGECYQIACDASKSTSCKPGAGAVTITATNVCPPNWALASNNGGWCNPPRAHFDMSQPAWLNIGVYKAGIIPILYQKVRCSKQGGIRFTIGGFNNFELVMISNVGGPGSIQSVSIKGEKTEWIQLTRNWGANWQCNAALVGQPLSFAVTSTNGQTIYINDIVPSWWKFTMSFTSNQQFTY